MPRKTLLVVAVATLVAGGSLVYSFLRPPAEASGAIQAIPLSMDGGADSAPVDGGASVASPSQVTAAPDPAAPPAAEVTTAAGSDPTPAGAGSAAKATPADAVAGAPVAADSGTPSPSAPSTEVAAAPAKKVSADSAPKASEQAAKGEAVKPATPAVERADTPAAQPTRSASAKSDKAAPAEEPKPRIFQIEPDHSTAQFNIDEVLRGEPKTVVGSTDQVAGQFGIVGTSLATVRVGPVLVNARTFETDNKYRDRSIKNKILKTDDFEYIRFEPTSVEGIPDTVPAGESFHFQVAGDLTITDVTRPVTFQMQARFVSPSEIEGVGTTSFPYDVFQLYIPKPPIVASVADTVHLELKFQAKEVY